MMQLFSEQWLNVALVAGGALGHKVFSDIYTFITAKVATIESALTAAEAAATAAAKAAPVVAPKL